MNRASKIIDQTALARFVDAQKGSGKKVVMISGSFDLFHESHFEALEAARSLGDTLIVLVNSDRSVRLYKGRTRPIIPELERARTLAALPIVDRVTIFNDLTPVSILELVHPTIYCTGADWGSDCVERDVIERHGGKICILPRGKISTTDIVSRMNNVSLAKGMPAVFLDRDGTLIEDVGYLHKPADICILPGVIEGLKLLRGAGYHLFIVTNQSGIGRGLFTQEAVEETNEHLQFELQKEGVRLDGIYYCPHIPEDSCACRKPGIGMLISIAENHDVILGKSWLIGNACSDVAAGRLANMKTILIRDDNEPCVPHREHIRARNFMEAVEAILTNKQ